MAVQCLFVAQILSLVFFFLCVFCFFSFSQVCQRLADPISLSTVSVVWIRGICVFTFLFSVLYLLSFSVFPLAVWFLDITPNQLQKNV